ncbi:MAG: hypothetical protein PHN88_02855 [Ignavibacteria bacterium]|nr:hypothetical protein [Ignavibacteria bacterium]
MANSIKIPIRQVVGGVDTPVTTGNYYLRKYPYTSITYTGSHIGDGIWDFGSVARGLYQLWDATIWITKYGTIWIDDDTLDSRYSPASVTTRVTGLEGATGNLLTWINTKASLTGTNSFSGVNTFGGNTTFTGDVIVPANSMWYNPTQQIYVDTQIDNVKGLISSYAGDAYQESPNVKRLIPSGSATGSVYTTWDTALASCSDATSNKQYTILICGEGTNASYINMALTAGKGFYDYVHMKGLGSDIKINTVGNCTLSGTDYSRGTIEGLEFIMNDSENPFAFYGKTFKNCKFTEIDSAGVLFASCNFEGVNTFNSSAATMQFTNCIGNRIYTTKPITVNGTNKIQYEMIDKQTIGNVILSDEGGNFKLSSDLVLSASISAHSGNLIIKSPTTFTQPTTIPQIILGSNNIADTGTGVEFSGGIDAYGNSNIVGNVSITGDLSLLYLLKQTPRTMMSTEKGHTGQICWDSSRIYVCIAEDTWKAVDLIDF